MHTKSLPPTDQDDKPRATYPHNVILREQLLTMREAGLSNSKLAGKIGMSSSVISQYLDDTGCIYSGDVANFERKAMDFIRNEARRKSSGVETMNCKKSNCDCPTCALRTALEYVRKTNDVGAIVAESGDGKSRGIEPYAKDNPTVELFQACSWHRHESALRKFFFEAAGKGAWDKQTPWMDYACSKLRGTDRLFVIDDAHKLPLKSLQLCVDVHDQTGCPFGFVGTFELMDKLERDPQLYSRVGLKWVIGGSRPKELIGHLINSLAPSVNGERAELVALCEQVASNAGHFRAVHKQLKLAAEMRETGTAFTSWVKAFRAAHTKMCRDYKLN